MLTECKQIGSYSGQASSLQFIKYIYITDENVWPVLLPHPSPCIKCAALLEFYDLCRASREQSFFSHNVTSDKWSRHYWMCVLIKIQLVWLVFYIKGNTASIYQAEGGRIYNSSLILSAVLCHRFIGEEFQVREFPSLRLWSLFRLHIF